MLYFSIQISKLLCAIILILLAQVPAAQDRQFEEQSIDFNLRLDPDNPTTGVFSARTADFGRLTFMEPRPAPFSNNSNLAEIYCVHDDSIKPVIYGEAERCDRIEWEVSFKNIDGRDVNVSEQKNLYSDSGWWALFEWDVIPRIKEDLNINLCIHHSDRPPETDCRSLPGLNQAPLLLIWGKSVIEFQSSGRTFRVFADSGGQKILNEKTKERLNKQYSYLSGLFPHGSISNSMVDIAWVGIDEKWKAVGGATGESAYISNYMVTENNTEMSLERLFWISGHETFHMISSFMYPLWISESLAHYYGYKSLAQYSQTLTTPIQEWDKKKESFPNSNTGLYAAHSKVLNNETSYYVLFYDKGAAFWHELDKRIENKGGSLDHYISLLSVPEQEDGELNKEFTSEIISLIGKQEFEYLVSEYLE